MIRVTIAAPLALIAAANQLARCIGYSEADGETFGPPSHQDASGALYAVASGLVQPAFVGDAISPLVEPAWGADMEAAGAAQAAIALWQEEAPVVATPETIAAIVGDDVAGALAALGLVPIEAP